MSEHPTHEQIRRDYESAPSYGGMTAPPPERIEEIRRDHANLRHDPRCACAGCDLLSALDALRGERDTAWSELRQIRAVIHADSRESTVDEVQRVVSQNTRLKKDRYCTELAEDRDRLREENERLAKLTLAHEGTMADIASLQDAAALELARLRRVEAAAVEMRESFTSWDAADHTVPEREDHCECCAARFRGREAVAAFDRERGAK